MSLKGDLGDAAWEFVKNSIEPPTIDAIVDHLVGTYRDELDAVSDRAIRAFARQAAKERLAAKRMEEDQQSLPGFHVPAAITVPVNEGGAVVYVASANATQAQWRAHRAIKQSNIIRAVDELRAYDELTDELNRVWETEPRLTVGRCIDRLNSELRTEGGTPIDSGSSA